jgi:tetratricopeptide (TPR) repeat protein
MIEAPEADLGEARARAERLVRTGRLREAREALLGGLEQTWAPEQTVAPAVRELGQVLATLGEARGAIGCAWYAGDEAAAEALMPQVAASDRARTLARRARAVPEADPRARALWARAASEYEAETLVAHAAICREKAGEHGSARALWSRLCDRIAASEQRDLYAEALARFNLARTSRALEEPRAAHDAVVASVRLLEEAADRFEALGMRDRAFDCYHVLVAVGSESATVEHSIEGYVNLVRILREDEFGRYAVSFYERAIELVRARGELVVAASLAREMAGFARAQALEGVANHALLQQAAMWRQVATDTVARQGPPEIAENALLSAVQCLAELGQFHGVGEVYVQLAHLPIEQARRAHYARASARYESSHDQPLAAAPLSAALRPDAALPEVWHDDLVEWEQHGRASHACADVLLDAEAWAESVRRRALLARLAALEVEASAPAADDEALVRLVRQLEQLELYVMLSPLEQLLGSPREVVRAAVAAALGRFLYKRTFVGLRRALSDPDENVRAEACRSMERLSFPHAFDPLARLHRETASAAVRAAALRALARVDTDEAAEMVLGVLRHAGPSERAHVVDALSGARNPRFDKLALAALSGESAEVAESIRAVLRARGAAGR